MTSDEELIEELQRRDRQCRRDFRASVIRYYRYLTRTTPEQMRADDAAYTKAVLERGWITEKQ